MILISLLAFVFFAPNIFPSRSAAGTIQNDSTWITAVRKLEVRNPYPGEAGENDQDRENTAQYQFDRSNNAYFAKSKPELFHFDPNTISGEEWEKLGIREKTIKTIQNYLSKGGHFYKPEDLSKIYGLRKEDYERLKSYISIEKKGNPSSFRDQRESGSTIFIKTDRYKPVEINEADTSEFIALPGIGSKLSARIVSFRDKLGGFYSVNQVAETFGLPDSTFQKIKQYLVLENPSLKKININTATVDELRAHPYIRYSLANPIVAYRNEHGSFSKVEDIKKIVVVTEEVYNKIAPYLTTE